MKSKLLIPFLVSICLGLFITSCDNNDDSSDGRKQGVGIEDFDLRKLPSQIGYLEDSICVIKSDSELLKLLSDGVGTLKTGIDYNKNSLLIASGYTPSILNSIEREFYYNKKEDKYILDVDVCMGMATMPDRWIIAILIPSGISKEDIRLDVNTSYCSEDDIHLTDFDLSILPCMPDDTEVETVYIINSDEEIHKLFTCEIGGKIESGINFSKKSLLLVRGFSTSGISAIGRNLEYVDKDKKTLKFNVYVYQNMATVVEEWYVAVLVDKLEKDITINLNVDKKAVTPKNIEVTDFDDSILPCEWADLKNDSIYVLNSNSDVASLLSCNIIEVNTGIDFEKNTLLLVQGVSNNGITSISKQMTHFPFGKEYRLDVNIKQNETEVIQTWKLALIVPKVESGSIIKLNTVYSK